MSDNKRNLSELEKKLKFIQDYLDNGNPKKALSEVEKLIKVYETSNRPQAMKALCLLRAGRKNEALNHICWLLSSECTLISASEPLEPQAFRNVLTCLRELYALLYERTLSVAAPEHSRELLRELYSSLTRLPYSLLPYLSHNSDHSSWKHNCRPIDTIVISHDRAMDMRKKQLDVATRIAKLEPDVDAQLLVLVSDLAKVAECAREMRRINSSSDASSQSEASKETKRVFGVCVNVTGIRLDRLRKSPLGNQLEPTVELDLLLRIHHLARELGDADTPAAIERALISERLASRCDHSLRHVSLEQKLYQRLNWAFDNRDWQSLREAIEQSLEVNIDNWHVYEVLLDSSQQLSKDGDSASIDFDIMAWFASEKVWALLCAERLERGADRARSPHLAQIELLSRARRGLLPAPTPSDDVLSSSPSSTSLPAQLLQFLERFSSTPSTIELFNWEHLEPSLFSQMELIALRKTLLERFRLIDPNGNLTFASDADTLWSNVMLHKLVRLYDWREESEPIKAMNANSNATQNGFPSIASAADSGEILLRYHHALRLGAGSGIAPEELHQKLADDYLQVYMFDELERIEAAHSASVERSVLSLRLAAILRIALRMSPANARFRLVLMRLLADASLLGMCRSPRLAYPLMKEAGIQNLQYLSIGHILVHDAARISLIGDGAHYATNLLFKTQRSVDETADALSGHSQGKPLAQLFELSDMFESMLRSHVLGLANISRCCLLLLAAPSLEECEKILSISFPNASGPFTGSNQMDWNDTRDLSVLNPSLTYLKSKLANVKSTSFKEDLLWMRLRELSLTVLYWLLVRLPRALGSASECRFTSSVTSENGDALSFSSSSGSANLPSCSAHSSTASGSSGCIAPLLKQLGELAAECTVVATCIENFFGDSRSHEPYTIWSTASETGLRALHVNAHFPIVLSSAIRFSISLIQTDVSLNKLFADSLISDSVSILALEFSSCFLEIFQVAAAVLIFVREYFQRLGARPKGQSERISTTKGKKARQKVASNEESPAKQLAESLGVFQGKWRTQLQEEISQLCANLESLTGKSARLGALGRSDLPLPRHPAADLSVSATVSDFPFSELERTYANECAELRAKIGDAYIANIAELKQAAASQAARLGINLHTTARPQQQQQ